MKKMENLKINALIIASLLLISACVATPPANTIQRSHIETFEQINVYYDQENYQAATTLLDQLAGLPELNNTEIAYIENYRANICFVQENYDCAFREFEKILEKKGSIPDRFYNQTVKVLFEFNYVEENYPEARHYGEQVLALDPNNPNLMLTLGNINYHLKYYLQSITYLLQALITFPEEHRIGQGQVNLQLGLVYEALGGDEIATQQYHKALSYALGDPENYGGIKLGLGSNKIRINEADKPLISIALQAYRELNQLDDAIKFVDSLDNTYPKIEHKLRIADYYEELGNTETAQSIRQELIDKEQAGYKDGQLIVWNSDAEIIPLFRAAPIYPAEAARRKQEGWVDLKLDIDERGKTKNIRVVDYSGGRAFEDAAIEAASRFLFKPIMKGGVPTDYIDYDLRITFKAQK